MWQEKSSNRIYFHGLEAQDSECLLASIIQPTVKGIVYHTGNMSSNISMNSDQNVFHWKSIIRNPNGGWYNFDSANGGYNHSLITNQEAGEKLVGKHILIISS